jgi:glycosyltransferase involved in cell wall biosynthesis
MRERSPDIKTGSAETPALVYFTHMCYPSPAAHAIQISRTVAALAGHARVYVIVKRMEGDIEEAESLYNLRLRGRVEFIPFNPRFGLLGMLCLLRRIGRQVGGRCVFYTRSYALAAKLIRLRFWHGRRVFFESHKKMGYHKEDFVPNSSFSAVRNAQEASNESRQLIEHIYKSSDCVFFLHEHSRKIAEQDLNLNNTVWNWYGIDDTRTPPERDGPYDFVYSGSVSKGKLVTLLLDASARLDRPFTFHIYGRCDAATQQWLEAEIDRRQLAGKVAYMGSLAFSELQRRLPDYRFGIATMEGIKVIDYMENGLTLVIPRNASHEEVFGDADVCYYQADDAGDLARAMRDCLQAEPRRRVSERLLHAFSLGARAGRIHAQLA